MAEIQDRKPYSLGARLSLALAVQTLAGLGVLSLAIYLAMTLSLAGRERTEIDRKVNLVQHLVAEASSSGNAAAMYHKLDEFLLSHEDIQLTLFDSEGKESYRSRNQMPTKSVNIREEPLSFPRSASTFTTGQLKLDRSQNTLLLQRLALILVVATCAGTAIISLGGFVLVRFFLLPVKSLVHQTRMLAPEKRGQRLSLQRPIQELQPWVDQFNDLLQRVERAYGQLESFNADVAHELRTPLATLIGQTEMGLSRPRTTEELQEILYSNLEELQRIASIINDMLFLSRADHGSRAQGRVTPLRQEVAAVIEFHEALLAERNLTARVDGEEIGLVCEPGLIRRAVHNLLSNAIRYAKPGSEIVVALIRDAQDVRVLVTNEGEEIPVDALPHLFKRFYRAHPSRERASENHGLGLSIVEAIARMHGGTTIAYSAKGRSSVGFSLPVNARPQDT